jgi:hypothetical protein
MTTQTPPKIALISGSDSRYYPILREWVASVRSFPQGQNVAIGIMDTGLTEAQRQDLSAHVTSIIAPQDSFVPLPVHKIAGKEFLKSCICRPFIPEMFKGYDVYVWMDADTWVQDWDAVELLIQGAQMKGLSVVPQSDRAYGKTMRLGWIGAMPWRPRSFYYSNAKKAFSGKVARQMFPFPTINAGVFAIAKDAPHWKRWQDLIRQALIKGKVFTAEQLTLGMLIYIDKMEAELLPAWCNWLCETKPLWDDAQKIFVEPYLPRRKLGIIHMSGCDVMRLDRAVTDDFKTTDGGTVKLSYRYPKFSDE